MPSPASAAARIACPSFASRTLLIVIGCHRYYDANGDLLRELNRIA
ncbi:hypothetical protein L2Y90_01645 [Burkholderia pyrrocinia]|nr:hypothetical protein L2Y90_01645 [Burkholderia pyrrocinia]